MSVLGIVRLSATLSSLAAIAGGLGWLILVRARSRSAHFGLVALATAAMVLAAALTLRVNIPINNQRMTWSVADNIREIWSRWECTHDPYHSVAGSFHS